MGTATGLIKDNRGNGKRGLRSDNEDRYAAEGIIMKNQYVGDIGDYGKYGLLRFLSQKGIRIGINWYLTEDDGSSDGKFTGYLKKPENRVFDPELFDKLREICSCKDKTVQLVEESGLLPKAVFYDKLLMSQNLKHSIRERNRHMWFRESILLLEDAELIFADPDNGISFSKNSKTKDSEKYILPGDIREYYDAGKNVVFYCHKGRRKTEEWEHTKEEIRNYVRDAQILAVTCHKGTQRSYIFVLHPDCYLRYAELLEEFLKTEWNAFFTWEPVRGNALSAAVQDNYQSKPIKPIKIEAVSIPFSVCKVPDYKAISMAEPFVFSGSTDQEKSLVCPTASVPDSVIAREDGWRAFRIIGELDFSLIGILADISRLLADKRIGIFAISTYNTDYILTKEVDFGLALKTLRFAGYQVKNA